MNDLRGIIVENDLKNILFAAVQAAESLGADYAEARWSDYRIQNLAAQGPVLNTMVDEHAAGIGVRVFTNGAWGFASGQATTIDDAVLLGRRAFEIALESGRVVGKPLELTPVTPHQAVWRSPMAKDPFDEVSLGEKTGLLLAITGELMKHDAIQDASAYMRFSRAHKVFANSAGSYIDQVQLWSSTDYNATAVGNDRFATRSFEASPFEKGYELVEELPLLTETGRVAEEAAAQLKAPVFEADRTDLILMPNHTRLVIHETIGHATELDRILGWEADYAGTSFATPEKQGNYRYGSDLFNVTGDRTQKHGMATCAFDDDGVPTRSFPMIRDGILLDYATTRDTAPFIGADDSNGCAFADSWSSFPILRMANVCIDPGPEGGPTLEALIASTDDGVLVDGMAGYSIDHQRINFQFGGDLCRRIRKGKVAEVIRNFEYEGSNPDFWSSMDAVCRPDEWKPYGLLGCAKGQPMQIAALTHGSAPLRLRNIAIRKIGNQENQS